MCISLHLGIYVCKLNYVYMHVCMYVAKTENNLEMHFQVRYFCCQLTSHSKVIYFTRSIISVICLCVWSCSLVWWAPRETRGLCWYPRWYTVMEYGIQTIYKVKSVMEGYGFMATPNSTMSVVPNWLYSVICITVCTHVGDDNVCIAEKG